MGHRPGPLSTPASRAGVTLYDPRAPLPSLAILGLGLILRFGEGLRAATEPQPMGMGDPRPGRTRDVR